MSDMETNLETIATGRYGKDVRAAIHDAIEENADNIATNTSDIADLKSNTGFEITSASPLNGCSASSIVGIDACGNSTQSGTPTPTNPIAIVDASGDVTAIGKNLFDKSNVNSINASIGTVASDGSGTLGSHNEVKVVYIECEPNTTYTISKDISNYCAIGFTTVEPNIGVAYKGMNSNRNVQNVTITSTSDAKYMIIYPATSSVISGGVTYDMIYQSLQVELGTTATDYIAYASNKITLPTLRSVGNVKDELIVNSDGSGQIIRRVGAIKVGETDWSAIGGLTHCYDTPNLTNAQKNLTSGMMGSCWVSGEVNDNKTNTIGTSGTGKIRVADTLTSVTDFKTQRANEWIYYPLATPTTTTLTASEVSAIRALQTYSGTTIIDSALDVKSVTYHAGVKEYIDWRFEQLATLMLGEE